MDRRPALRTLLGVATPALFCLLILLPHVYSKPTYAPDRWVWDHWGWPLLHSGDEPHYLVYANSLFRDGDFDLSNNYQAAHDGGMQAGRIFAERALQHHSVYYIDGEHTLWWDLYRIDTTQNGREWRITPRLRARGSVKGLPEYGLHPPGLPLFLTAVFKPLGDPELLESGGLLLSGVMVILAMFAFRAALGRLGTKGPTRELITAAVFFGSPIWYYGRTLYTESFTLCFSLAAFALFLSREDRIASGRLLPGILLALAILMRPVSVLLCLPFGVDLLLERRWKDLVAIATPPILAALFLLHLNDAMFGSPFRSAQAAYWGNPASGLMGLLFSPRSGLLAYAPALLLALVAWPSFLREHRRPALLALGMAVPSLLLVASWEWWDGGFAYGPRLIVPLIPFLFMSAVQIPKLEFLRPWPARTVMALLCALSILINFLGATEHARYASRHPLRGPIVSLLR